MRRPGQDASVSLRLAVRLYLRLKPLIRILHENRKDPLNRMTSKLFILGFVAVLAQAPAVIAQDEDHGKRWYLDVKYSKLAPLVVTSAVGKDRVYWYTILEVTNKTGAARKLDLVARALHPEDKKNSESLPGLHPEATQKIAKKVGKEDLVNILALSGEIGDGESKSVAVVFSRISDLAHFIHVRVGGLTNSVYVEGKKAWREKTEVQLAFHRVGDEFDVTKNEVFDKGKTWITVERSEIR
ncbi:MAG TPA: hypothetical protein PKE00_10840 [Planctomycetota bacterium]|nr:hypothetical protein [Planctomycetota bacterium]